MSPVLAQPVCAPCQLIRSARRWCCRRSRPPPREPRVAARTHPTARRRRPLPRPARRRPAASPTESVCAATMSSSDTSTVRSMTGCTRSKTRAPTRRGASESAAIPPPSAIDRMASLECARHCRCAHRLDANDAARRPNHAAIPASRPPPPTAVSTTSSSGSCSSSSWASVA